MIRIFKIKQSKDSYGVYILPNDLKNREDIQSAPILYPKEKGFIISQMYDKNLLFAIICVVYEGKKEKTDVNSWGFGGVMINNYFLPYDRYYLDSENDVIYETDKDEEKLLLKRLMKLKKLKKNLKNEIFYI